MNMQLRYLGQAVFYILFVAFLGYFSTSPAYTHVPADKALIKFAFTHPGKRVTPFEDKRTKEEMAKLPPQLRAKKHSRERSPIRVKFEMDGKIVYEAEVPPRGLSRDLPSPVYERFIVPPGEHHFRVSMGDDVHDLEHYNFVDEYTVTLKPLQTLVIDFDNNQHHFVFK